MKTPGLEQPPFGIRREILRACFLLAIGIIQLSVHASGATRTSSAGGNWNNPATWIGGTVPSTGDNVVIQHPVVLSSNATCSNLTVQAGKLTFGASSGRSYSLKVSGNVSVNTLIEHSNAANGNHVFAVGGNISNFGSINLFSSATVKTDLHFTGNTDSYVYNFGGAWSVQDVIVNKSIRTTIIDVADIGFENGLRKLTVTKGTYVHDNNGVFNLSPTVNYVIGPQAIFRIASGTMGFSTAADSLVLQGELHVTGGTVNVGNSAGLQGIVYDRSDTSVTPFLNIAGGGLQVKGGITNSTFSWNEPFRFSMHGGFLLLNGGTTGTKRHVFNINDVQGSNFTMSGGSITLQQPTGGSGSHVSDFSVCGMNGTVNVTAGSVQFGLMSTTISKGFSFTPFFNPAFPGYTFPHFVVAAPYPANGATLSPSANSTSNFNVLSIQICAAAKFDVRSVNGASSGDGRIINIKGANAGIAFANSGVFTERTSTVRFFPPNGANIPQIISGLNSATISFYRMDIANPNHVTLQYPVKLSNHLSLTSGKLNTTSLNVLTCLSGATTSSGSTNSFVNGPLIHTVATTAGTKYFPVGKDGAFRPMELQVSHSDNSAVTYEGEVFNIPANTLPPCIPPSLASVSNVRYARFTRIGPGQFLSGSITMHYGNDDGVGDLNSLVIAQENYPSPSCWMNLGQDITGTGSPVLGWIRADIAQFNPQQFGSTYFSTYFSLANPPGGGNYLPVSMTDLGAECVGENVRVHWSTDSEINCDKYAVERSSNERDYTVIGELQGGGNTTLRLDYSFTDDQPVKGLSYYRIRQLDYDGGAHIFGPVAVRVSPSSFTLYPNPCTNREVRLSLNSGSMERFSIRIHDAIGREIPFRISENGNNELSLHIDSDSKRQGAFYIVTATDGLEVYQEKLLIQ
ncbi:MAG: hypothetical protein RL021_1564 [Bacteroidota bacterium]